MGIAQNGFNEIIAISAGKDQTLALLKSKSILAWGSAGSGRVTSLNADICGNNQPNTGAV